jgi:ergothioneine biosynthesis protein EgtB
MPEKHESALASSTCDEDAMGKDAMGKATTKRASIARLAERFRAVRQLTATLCEPLQPEDCVIQSMTEVSPIRWHLAHTTWFFETFILQAHVPGYRAFDANFNYLFNSYYNSVGKQFPRTQRGNVSRPTVSEIWQYRHHVDAQVLMALEHAEDGDTPGWLSILELGLQHEQQHQELMLTDIKHVFSCNPLYPVYRPWHPETDPPSEAVPALEYREFDRQIVSVGHAGDGFAFDNELPRHEVLLHPYRIGNRLVTNEEYLEFIRDNGYARPTLWLSLGWDAVQTEQWQAPLHWIRRDDVWYEFTLHGLRPLEPHAPVCHVSFFEADAFARWGGKRLPTEFEWEHAAREHAAREHAAREQAVAGNFVETGKLHPVTVRAELRDARDFRDARTLDASRDGVVLKQMFGDVWEWTSSPYLGYPGYRPAAGALGEYNGKFMCNQFVLRGGSCATSLSHFRVTYRNFFPPAARWQFFGIRLAESKCVVEA